MKIAKHINDIAFVYIGASVVIGPGLIFLISSFSPGPTGDCGDDAWGRAGIHGPGQIIPIIRHYDFITQLSEGAMFCVGAIIVGLLIAQRHKSFGPMLFGVLFIMLCYGFAVYIFGVAPCGSD